MLRSDADFIEQVAVLRGVTGKLAGYAALANVSRLLRKVVQELIRTIF